MSYVIWAVMRDHGDDPALLVAMALMSVGSAGLVWSLLVLVLTGDEG